MSDSSPTPEPKPALRALGHALRQGREDQGLTIAELAGKLHMGSEQLQALEEGDPSRLPEPVFVIAQARRVATSLSINLDAPLQALRESNQFPSKPLNLAELSLSGQRSPATEAACQSPTNGATSASLRGIARLALAAGIVVGLAAGAALGWQQWQLQQIRLSLKRAPAQDIAPIAEKRAVASESELILRSDQPSWLEVKTETGTNLFRGMFQGERRFPLARGLQVLTGRPDLVLAQQGNGPAKPLGRIDQVRWQRFTAPAP